MIFAPLDKLRRDCPDARLIPGLQFLVGMEAGIAPGRHELPGGGYVMVDAYTTVEETTHHFEAHRQYIDIHVLLSGEEQIQYAPLADMTTHTPYVDNDDYALFTQAAGAGVRHLVLVPGFAAVFYPEDAHRPGIIAQAPCAVRKAVVKVPV